MTSGRRAARIVQSGMVIAAAITALSFMAAISRTPDSQFPTPNGQQGTVGTQGDPSSGADPAAPPISVERIREALQRPPALTIPAASRAERHLPLRRRGAQHLFESVLEGMRRDLRSGPERIRLLTDRAAGTFYPSRIGGGVDVLPLISGGIKQWKAARARDRVRKELAAFCAVNDCSILEGEAPPPEGILRPPFETLTRQRPIDCDCL